MKKLLLDSSILIDFLRLKKKEESYLYKLTEKNNQLYASIISHTELYSGKSAWESKKVYLEIKDLFYGITLIPLTEEISEKAGEIRAKFDLDVADSIIAATANHVNLDLVTLNTKDFEKIRGVKLLLD